MSQVSIISYSQFKSEEYFDRLSWSFFEGRLSLLLIYFFFGLNFRSVIVLLLLWIRTKTEESVPIRRSLTGLILLLLFTLADLDLIKLILPIELAKVFFFLLPFLLHEGKKILASHSFHLHYPEAHLLLENFEESSLIYSPTNFLFSCGILVPNNYFLYHSYGKIFRLPYSFEIHQVSKLCTLCSKGKNHFHLCQECKFASCIDCLLLNLSQENRCNSCEKRISSL